MKETDETMPDVCGIHIADYDYPLDDARIAKRPLADRDRCLLLTCDSQGNIADKRFDALPELLTKGSLMVCNNTRVINARLQFRKPTGSVIEVFLLEPEEPSDYALVFQTRGRCVWKCMVGNLKRWKQDALERAIALGEPQRNVTLRATRMEACAGNSHFVELQWDDPSATFADIVDAAGRIPIPPYLGRASEECDDTDYQTVYSKIKGSVAAPTAGLHFTDEMISTLADAGIERHELTLHVGAGTFQPVKSGEIGGHPMHTEVYGISRDVLEAVIAAKRAGQPLTAVGTTSVRTLESLPYAGRHIMRGEDPHVTQWEAYSGDTAEMNTIEMLEALAAYMDSHGMTTFTSSTAIMIAPGFRWRITDAMVTNFHQPQSTLLLLVSSFLGKDEDGGERWRRVYDHALAGSYRFLSYGDACLFFRASET